MGPCSSYDDVVAMDASIAKEIIAHSDICGVVLPSNISTCVFVKVAGDHNDKYEDTIVGKRTTHATTLVLFRDRWLANIVQHCVHIQEECAIHEGTPWPELCWRAIDHGTVPDVCQNRNI